MEWNGMEWNEMKWNGMEGNGMEWNGMEWNGMEWNGMEWNGMNIYESIQSIQFYLLHKPPNIIRSKLDVRTVSGRKYSV
jgi:hypothetical protein